MISILSPNDADLFLFLASVLVWACSFRLHMIDSGNSNMSMNFNNYAKQGKLRFHVSLAPKLLVIPHELNLRPFVPLIIEYLTTILPILLITEMAE